MPDASKRKTAVSPRNLTPRMPRNVKASSATPRQATPSNATDSNATDSNATASDTSYRGQRKAPTEERASEDSESHSESESPEKISGVPSDNEDRRPKSKKGKKTGGTKGGGKKVASKAKRPPTKRVALHKRLGLFFPVGRISSYLKRGNFSHRVGRAAPVAIAAVLDYMVAELADAACDVAQGYKKATVKPRHILTAIKEDAEMYRLLGNVVIAQAGRGCRVEIHAPLLNSRSNAKKSARIREEVQDTENANSEGEEDMEESQEFGDE